MALQINFNLVQEQRLKLLMTPELRQAIQLLQYSAVELDQYVQEQLVENPLLEVVEHDHPETWQKRAEDWFNYLQQGSRYSSRSDSHSSQDSPLDYLAREEDSLYDMLLKQIGLLQLPKNIEQICRYLIGNIDEKGYLEIDYPSLCKRFQIDTVIWERCLEILHSLEPAGIGARSLSECIEIQLRREEVPDQLAIEIARNYLQDVAKGKLRKIAHQLSVDVTEVQEAIDKIKQCNPFPAGEYSARKPQYVQPDVYVEKIEGDYHVYMHGWHNGLRMNSEYVKMIKQQQIETETASYLKNWMQSALWLMKGIEQRRETIVKVTYAIVEKQKAFFDHGKIEQLKPLTLKKVADEIGIHESTVSRATQNKYIQTPHGLYPFRFFFPTGLSTDVGGNMNMNSVKNRLQQLIDSEDKAKPLSDQKLAKMLNESGIRISRRTVTKYREELGIPSSTVRKRYK